MVSSGQGIQLSQNHIDGINGNKGKRDGGQHAYNGFQNGGQNCHIQYTRREHYRLDKCITVRR